MQYNDLKRLYSEHFSLGYLNVDINSKFALISIICYITYKSKQKYPDINHYQIIMKLSKGIELPDDFIKGLSIICDDFSYGCTEFPTFNLDKESMIKQVREILNSYIPF